jgi:predicted porin
MAMGTSAQAQAQGLQVKISGHVNRALMAVDDGQRSETFFVDNDNSSTRFRFVGSADLTPGLKAGVLWEVEYQGNDSNLVNMPNSPTGPGRSTGGPTFGERHTNVFLEGRWGKLTLGQGDGAANGGVEVDLSGTSVAHYAGNTDIAGGFHFRDAAGALTGPTITASSSQQDFESRYDLVRYDTPVFGGFRLAGSFGTKGNSDVKELALWYSSNLGAIGRLAGALGYSRRNVAAGDDEIFGGSISWLHGSGFNLTLGATNRDDPAAGRDKKFGYVKVGYKTGKHAFSVDFGRGEDQAAAGDEADFYGVGYVYNPVAWADIYALLKQHTLDRPSANFQDVTVLLVGTRVRF